MSTSTKFRVLVILAVFGAMLAGTPLHAQVQAQQSLPDGLEDSVKVALEPNYHPMQFPATQQAKLLASDRGTEDSFGTSVDVSSDGNTVVIGAMTHSDLPSSYNGSAYVFIRIGSNWIQQAKLLSPNRHSHDNFGTSVSISGDGNKILVGAPYEKGDQGQTSGGAAYLFVRDNASWSLQTKLASTDLAAGDLFGMSVALSSDGNTALVGASSKNDYPTRYNGAAYVFVNYETQWTQQAKLNAIDKDFSDYFGNSVALSSNGNTALIGAKQSSDEGNAYNGAAYIFVRNGTQWFQQVKLLASDKMGSAYFGHSVAISSNGDIALIGAPESYDSVDSYVGAAYIFMRDGTQWSQQQKLLAYDKEARQYFGYSVALASNGDTVVVGTRPGNSQYTTRQGEIYLFTRSDQNWINQTKLIAPDGRINDDFGVAAELSSFGTTLIVGARRITEGWASYCGAAYIFVEGMPTETPSTTSTVTYTSTSSKIITPSYTSTATFAATATPTPSSTHTLTLTLSNTPTDTLTPPRPDTIGAYKNGVFYLRNTNNSGGADITAFFGGDPSDLPIVGDWNGDGADTIGVYRNSTGFFFLSDSNTAPAVNYTVLFGNPGDTPFAGKWTADMTHDGIGVYRNSNGILYQRKSLTSGFDDFFAVFGNPGDQGVAGDWDFNNFDSIGIYRSSNQTWYLTNNSAPSGITFSDINFVWDIGTSTPVVGDWDGNGDSTVGYLTASGVFVLHPNNATAGMDNVFAFGPANSKPIAGKWVAGSKPPISSVIQPITGKQPGSNPVNGSGGD